MKIMEMLTEERQLRGKTETQINKLTVKLEETEKERDRLKAVINLTNQKKERSPVDELELKEEKLQLQVQIENLKLSNSNEVKEMEERFSLERSDLIGRLEETKKELEQQTSDSKVRMLYLRILFILFFGFLAFEEGVRRGSVEVTGTEQ